jgi:hypothetical protein
MADKDYMFTIFPDSLEPQGPIGKENLDVVRLQFDFSCYLDTSTSETIDLVQFPTISVAPSGVSTSTDNRHTFQPDYPIINGSPVNPATTPPADNYPLRIVSEAITNMGLHTDVRINSGTPGFTYVVSFVIVGSTTRRRKQVDTLVHVEDAVNPLMVGPGQLDPDIIPPIIVNGSTALPMGFNGLVILQNTGNNSNIVVTLPPNPELGQTVDFIDALGKDELYPVTFRGDGDVPVDGDLSSIFVSNVAYDVLRFIWMGTNWHLESQRFGFLA